MVAWAGSYLQARLAVRELHEAVLAGATTSQDALSVLMSKPENEVSDLSLLGMIVRPDGKPNGISVGQFAMNCATHEINGVDTRLAGTGEWHLLGLLPLLIPNHTDAGDQENLKLAIEFGASLAGVLIGREMETGVNLPQMWGGAIEVGYIAKGSVQKLDEVLHLNCRVEPIGDELAELVIWSRLTHYRYVKKHLIVSVLEFVENGLAEERRFVVRPLLNDEDKLTPRDLMASHTFEHKVLNVHVSFEPSLSGVAFANLTKIASTALEQVRVTFSGKEIRAEIEPSLLDQVHSFAQGHINRQLQ